jgi:bifunctional non-homologous end joining protein LigD
MRLVRFGGLALARALQNPPSGVASRNSLQLDGRDLTREPIEERKRLLADLLNRIRHPGLQLSEHIDLPGDLVFAHACKLGCEGIVSKRLGSRYRPGPNKLADWIKAKNSRL